MFVVNVDFFLVGIFLMWMVRMWLGNLWIVFVKVLLCDFFVFLIIKFRFVLFWIYIGFCLLGNFVWYGENLKWRVFILSENLFIVFDGFKESVFICNE